MNSSNLSQTVHAELETQTIDLNKNPDSGTPNLGTSDPPTETQSMEKNTPEESIKEEDSVNGEELEEEEEGECGFCLFMKGGGCKDTFTEWEKCVEEGEKNNEDIVEKCFQATSALKLCMEAHSDYYAPLLQAEKAAEVEAAKQLEEEKERLSNKEDDGLGKNGKAEAVGDSDIKENS